MFSLLHKNTEDYQKESIHAAAEQPGDFQKFAVQDIFSYSVYPCSEKNIFKLYLSNKTKYFGLVWARTHPQR